MHPKANGDERRCCECGRLLKDDGGVWLEMDTRDASLYEPGTVPEEYSQGCFRVGNDCAKKMGRVGLTNAEFILD